MAEKINIFSRIKGENIADYDNRISNLPLQHIGYAFFECCNYDIYHHTFSLYITWNDRINGLLEDKLPPCGFIIHCSEQVAVTLSNERTAQPILAKFTSCDGIINVTNLLFRFCGRNYAVSYTGAYVHIPDESYYFNINDIDNEFVESYQSNNGPGNSSFANSTAILNRGSFNVTKPLGSYRYGSFNAEGFKNSSFYIKYFNNTSFKNSLALNTSFRNISANISSFNLGSFNFGAINGGSFNLSSFNVGSFNFGSFNWNLFNLSSFNLGSFNWNFFNLGTFNRGSFNRGSFNLSSFSIETFTLSSFNLSSFNMGSNRFKLSENGSFNTGSFRNVLSDEQYYNNNIQGLIFEDFLKEIFGIGYMGYGLNLI